MLASLRKWWLRGLFTYLFLFAGLGLLVYTVIQARTALSARDWPTVNGQVTYARMVVDDSDDDGPTYKADIRYVYEVNGQEFRGNRISQVDMSTSDSNAVQKILTSYPVGQGVQVYYDPASPQNALLKPGLSGGFWLIAVLSAGFTLVGGGMTWSLVRAIQSDRSEQE